MTGVRLVEGKDRETNTYNLGHGINNVNLKLLRKHRESIRLLLY
jgi:hypothetical protein